MSEQPEHTDDATSGHGDDRDSGEVERGNQYSSCFVDPVILNREDDILKGRYHESSGISDPAEEVIDITQYSSRTANAGSTILKIPADEIDNYIRILTVLKEQMEAANGE